MRHHKPKILFFHVIFAPAVIQIVIILLASCSQTEIGDDSPEQTDSVHIDYLKNPSAYQSIWRDDFNTFENANWTIGLKDPLTGHMVPAQGGQYLLNDNYAGYITEEDSYVNDGKLILRNQKRNISGTDPDGNYEYTSGWVMSMHKRFENGTRNPIYLEVKAKFPIGDKVWPAIWMIPERLVWPPEIDLWEYFGQFFNWDKDQMYMRYIHGHYTDKEDVSEKIDKYDQNYNADVYHTYGFQWSATKMIWSIDGIIVHTLEKGKDVGNSDWPDEEMYIVINNGVINVVPDENTIWPNYFIIDYIELFELQ